MTKRRDADEAREIMVAAGYEPLEPYRSLKHKWRCTHLSCGREVAPTLGQIIRGQGGCKYCARVFVDPDAAVRVMREAGYEPLEPYVSSGHRWRCRCLTCSKETFPRYDEARVGSRCIYCARKRLDPADAVSVMTEAGFEPLEPYPGSMEPWECLHTCGHVVRPRYAHIQQGRRGCIHCSRAAMAEQFRWADDEARGFVMDLGYEPLEKYPGRNSKNWRMRHLECGREIAPRLASLQQGQGGCKPCHQDRLAKKYQLPPEIADARIREAGFEPLDPYPGRSHAPWRLVHSCGRESRPTLANVHSGSGCAWCADKRVDPSDAEAFWKEQGLEPLVPYPGNKTPWRSRHSTCGREVSPTWNALRSGQGPCKFCASHGFNREAPAILYLIRNETLSALKVGVTSEVARNSRLKAHADKGWTLVDSRHIKSGEIAEILEAAVLTWWRSDLSLPTVTTRTDMPQGGWTETAPEELVDVPLLWTRIDSLIAEIDS